MRQMEQLQGARLHITGVVQGVGFRPFVYTLALRHNLKGWVRNTSAGVDIQVDGTLAALGQFVEQLRLEAPPWLTSIGLSTNFARRMVFRPSRSSHPNRSRGPFSRSPPMSVSAPNAWQKPWTLLQDVIATHLPTAPIAVLVSQSSMTFLMTDR